MLRRRPRHRHGHPKGLSGRRQTLAIWLAALAVGLAASGCGGGGSSSGSSGSSAGSDASGQGTTTGAFIARAQKICAGSKLDLQSAFSKEFGTRQPSSSELIRFTEETGIPSVERQLDDLRALTAPAEGRATLERYLSTLEQAIEDLKGDPSVVTRRAEPPGFNDANRVAIAYGIGACSR